MEIKVREASSIKKRVVGLIGKDEIKPLLIKTRFGIHTFGMKQPIDVIILDDEYKVRKLKKCLKPWRMLIWNPKYLYVLELPSGYIEKKRIKKNTVLNLVISD